MLYSVVLVSATKQPKSVTIIHTHTHIYIYPLPLEPPLPLPFHPSRSSQHAILGALCEQGLWSKTALSTEDMCIFLAFSEPQFSHLCNGDNDGLEEVP